MAFLSGSGIVSGKIVSGKIERKPGAQYLVNGMGEVVEMLTTASVIGKVERKNGFEYALDKEGFVREFEVREIAESEFNALRKSGELKKLYAQGVRVKVMPDATDTGLFKAAVINQEKMFQELAGRKIASVEYDVSKNGVQQLKLLLDDGSSLALEEALFAGGTRIKLQRK